DETAWFQCQGEAPKIITSQDAIRMAMEKSREILDSHATSREKLFQINRNIITMLNERSKGQEYEWPLRLEAMMIKEKGQWVVHYLHFSYPCNNILEGKTDAAVLVE
ncbi:MAG TPA: hypothetical protein VLN47_05790, partial [Clostridiaceae bacterium]|nr:hypothetical protein [Clostridiaceae bacterium]